MSPETNAIIFKIVMRQIFLSSSNPGLVSLELVVVEPWLSSPFTVISVALSAVSRKMRVANNIQGQFLAGASLW